MIQAHYQGVIIPYKNYVGKKYDEIDEKIELDQKQDTGVEPVDSDITIQFNSTYLEVLDKAYIWRGGVNFFSIGFFLMCIFGVIMMILIISKLGFSFFNFFMFGLLIVFLAFSVIIYNKLLKKDLFGYTHYPIRFNKNNKKVYVFKDKNDIRVFDWEKLKVAFTRIDTGNRRKREYDIRFSQLANDGTIIDAFSLPFLKFAHTIEYTEKDGYQFSFDGEALWFASNWEYIRSYMEEDIETSYKAVRGIKPLDKKRESILQNMKVAWNFTSKVYSFKEIETLKGTRYLVDIQKTYNDGYLAILVNGIGFFIILINFIGRFFVMNVAKKPKWSKQVDDDCVIDSNDRYNFEKYPNKGHEKAHETLIGICIKMISFCLCYLSVYGLVWIFDIVAEARGSGFPIYFSDYLAFWKWF